ncbi:MAG: hypothetical protein Kow006_18200 [Gammaproteobacteria bacterium]
MTSLFRLFLGSFFCIFLATVAVAAEAPGFKYENQVYAGETLPPSLKQKLFELEVELNRQRRQAIDAHVIDRYVAERATRENRTVEQIQNELFRVQDPDEAEVKGFYDANRSRIRGSFEQVRGQIAEYLRNQRRQQRVAAVLETIRKEKGYEVYLAEPEAPLMKVATEGYPFKGSPDAKVTIVEFADYQCPHCKDAMPVMKRLLERYGDKVRVVFRNFPINRSGISRQVAVGAVCAGEQGRFWEYHDLAFERQNYLMAITPKDLADELGLDIAKFEACFKGDAAAAKVARSLDEGRRLGISGTPTFYVNGRQLHVHGDLESSLSAVIDRELAR